jgi:hypothetical protein
LLARQLTAIVVCVTSLATLRYPTVWHTGRNGVDKEESLGRREGGMSLFCSSLCLSFTVYVTAVVYRWNAAESNFFVNDPFYNSTTYVRRGPVAPRSPPSLPSLLSQC